MFNRRPVGIGLVPSQPVCTDQRSSTHSEIHFRKEGLWGSGRDALQLSGLCPPASKKRIGSSDQRPCRARDEACRPTKKRIGSSDQRPCRARDEACRPAKKRIIRRGLHEEIPRRPVGPV